MKTKEEEKRLRDKILEESLKTKQAEIERLEREIDTIQRIVTIGLVMLSVVLTWLWWQLG